MPVEHSVDNVKTCISILLVVEAIFQLVLSLVIQLKDVKDSGVRIVVYAD